MCVHIDLPDIPFCFYVFPVGSIFKGEGIPGFFFDLGHLYWKESFMIVCRSWNFRSKCRKSHFFYTTTLGIIVIIIFFLIIVRFSPFSPSLLFVHILFSFSSTLAPYTICLCRFLSRSISHFAWLCCILYYPLTCLYLHATIVNWIVNALDLQDMLLQFCSKVIDINTRQLN